jgi:predicted DNA-binding transcriptional regulator AlpA
MLSLLTEEDVAEELNLSLASLRRWRLEKRGPRFIKVGSLVRYRPEDIEVWLLSLPTGGSNKPVAHAGLPNTRPAAAKTAV